MREGLSSWRVNALEGWCIGGTIEEDRRLQAEIRRYMDRKPATNFQNLIVWQKSYAMVLAQDLGYGNATEFAKQAEEVSKSFESYAHSILSSIF